MLIPNQSNAIYNAVEPNKAGVRGSITSNTVHGSPVRHDHEGHDVRQNVCQRRRNRP